LVGIAPVERFEGAPKGHHPVDLLPGARSVVVFALRAPRGLLACECNRPEPALIPEDERWAVKQQVYSAGGAGFFYPTANTWLQMMGLRVAYLLEDRGYTALPLPASGYRALDRYAYFSHRHAAVLAGLGEFGLNNLLLTPQYGPRQRLNSVITTARLDPDALCPGPICLGEQCGLCLQADDCFGERYELEMAGKTMRLARFSGVCPTDACRHGERPYIRFCWGICPVGKGEGR
jgi:epoxyqueuosine reductase QueG